MTLALVVIAGAAAQTLPATLDSNAILGFENPGGWIVRSNNAFSTTASSTTTRTQGSFAFALSNPADLTTLTSAPVASTAHALVGIGDAGAIFEVDVMLPIQQGNPVNRGSLQLFISSPSTGLNNVRVGKVDFTGFRLGIYNTMKFPIPDGVRSALGGATFSDLTFQFMLSSPGTGAGTYLFDNLRVDSVPLVTANASTQPPPGYGGSVDVVAIGNTPTTQFFNIGPVQVPDSFHLKLGTAGATTVALALGYDGAPAFTCTYSPDPSDLSGKSYGLMSCTGDIQAGDLVGANWAQLTIVGGDASMKIRAQLAQSPVGDQVGAGIIPAMPTFWGDFDGCVPAPVAGTIVTVSSSCAAQTAQANQIVTAYFNKVSNSNTQPNWIVTPKPEFAGRQDDGSPHDNLTGPPPLHDPPFDQEGHMNPGGNWDAYWRLNGDLTPKNYEGTDHNTITFDATFSTHAVLFGLDVNILAINTLVKTDTGETTPIHIDPSSSGNITLMLFGIEIPPGGYSASPGVDFHISPSINQDFNLPPIHIWIFSITIGATASVGIDADLVITSTSLGGQITPHGSVGAHLEGAIDVFIASGGVDARISLLSAATPVSAQADWFLNTSPAACSVTLTGELAGHATIGSGGGEVDLVASFGFCPFCFDESWTLFRWDPLVSYTKQLFDFQLAAAALPLPPPACTAPLTVSISTPTPGAVLQAKTPYVLNGSAFGNGGAVPCNSLTWLLGAGAMPSTNVGCNVTETFTQDTTINLSATVIYTNQFGAITESGAAIPVSITVTPLPPGDYIQQIMSPSGQDFAFCNAGSMTIGGQSVPPSCVSTITVPQSPPGTYTLSGFVSGASGATCTTWSGTDPNGNALTIQSGDPSSTSPTATWTTSIFPLGTPFYKFTMTTTNGACGQTGATTFGSATVMVTFANPT